VAAAPAIRTPAATAKAGARAIHHVLIISEDGLRPDALMDVHPPVHEAMMKRGAYSLTARTIRHASTLPSHAAMLSGFDVPEHGLFWNSWKPERGYIQVPTVFDAAEHDGRGAAAFVGKQKLAHIAHPGSVDVFSRPGYFCKKVAAEAARYFVEKKPEVEFVHFSDPDDKGHAIGWMSVPQLDAIRETDRCLGTLLDAVSAAGLDRDTLVILSADHGGHGRNHSGNIKEDRLIPWIACGPGVRSGHRIESPISTVDTAATTLWALGYPPPKGLEGRPVLEAFDRDEDPERVVKLPRDGVGRAELAPPPRDSPVDSPRSPPATAH
jgi:arylsulfatase A-like enzyme